MTALSIAQAVAGRIGINIPTVLFTSTDGNVQQLRELLIESAEALSKRGDPGWQSLQAEWAFVTVNQFEQTNTPLPPDLRAIIPDSAFNRTTNRKVAGPLTPQQYQQGQIWPQLAAPYLTYRERGGLMLMEPAPPAGQTIAYEYISSYWAKSSANVAKATFTSDDDGTYLDEELLKLDVRWRWKAAKGLDYGEDMETAEREIMKALGRDGGAGALDLNGTPLNLPPWRYNVPEGNWPGT